jgi:hypothetical protein
VSKDDGLVEPFTPDGHSTAVDAERFRVTCSECPWFQWMPDATVQKMKRAGWSHRDATRLRD